MNRKFFSILIGGATFLSSGFATAGNETLQATCTIFAGSPIGKMEIFASDNGDEGFLRFNYVLNATHVSQRIAGEFVDNIQDAGVAFLRDNSATLYVPIEGAAPRQHRMTAVAVYLSNHRGVISGLFKAGFIEGSLKCKAKRLRAPRR